MLEVKENIMSVKNNTNLIGCISDAVTGNFIISKSKIDKAEAMQMLSEAGKTAKISKKQIEGREIFSEILPKINFSAKTRSCLGEECSYYNNCKKEKCPYDAYLSIENGKMISGIVDRSSFGVEDGELIKVLDKEVGREKLNWSCEE